MIAHWLTGKVEYRFQARPWQLLFTHRALLLCQDATGFDILSTNLLDPRASLLRGLLFGVLRAAGAECSLEEVGREFRLANVPLIRHNLIDAWIASMPDPKRDPYRPESPRPKDKLTWIRKWAYETSRDGLGIPEDRWLDMTPRQVQELEILRLAQMQREELLIGILSATVENFSAVHPKKPVSPGAFMLHPFDPDEMEDSAVSVGDKIYAYYSQFPSFGDAGPAPRPEARVPLIQGAMPV